MKRSEGILKRWKLDNNKSPVSLKGKKLKDFETQLIQSEYNNYTDLCYYCYEEPLPYNEWINQTIKPVK